MDGTSMATPHVAGIVALLLQAKPDATAVEIQKALLDSSDPIQSEPPLRWGRGKVRPLEALNVLTGTAAPAAAASRRKRAVKSKRGRKK